MIHTQHARPDLARILNRGTFNPSQTPNDVSHLSLQLHGAHIGSACDPSTSSASENRSGSLSQQLGGSTPQVHAATSGSEPGNSSSCSKAEQQPAMSAETPPGTSRPASRASARTCTDAAVRVAGVGCCCHDDDAIQQSCSILACSLDSWKSAVHVGWPAVEARNLILVLLRGIDLCCLLNPIELVEASHQDASWLLWCAWAEKWLRLL